MVERFRSRVSEGMQVRSSDGERLGKVVACQPNGFVVEKGFLFPKDLLIPYERITNLANGEILIAMARADLAESSAARTAAATEAKAVAHPIKETLPGEAEAATGEGERLDEFGKAGQLRVSLVEEEILASKHVEKVGEVHIHKEVVTEEKQITVPVTREVIRVERVPVTHEVRAGDKIFEKESYDIPICEEHVTIEKHPVVHEEIRVGKEIQQAEETASATVRHERAEVDTKGAVRRAEAPRGGSISGQAGTPLSAQASGAKR